MNNEHPINKILEESLTKIKSIIDVNTVVGSPIVVSPELTIIPITKVSVGFVAGGGEYSQNIPPKKQKDNYPFAGGSGAGFNISPLGFLIQRQGNMQLVSVDNKSSFEKLVEMLASLVKKLNDK